MALTATPIAAVSPYKPRHATQTLAATCCGAWIPESGPILVVFACAGCAAAGRLDLDLVTTPVRLVRQN